MRSDINLVASKIRTILECIHHPINLKDIRYYLDEPSDILNKSISWLIQEGEIILEEKRGDCWIAEAPSEFRLEPDWPFDSLDQPYYRNKLEDGFKNYFNLN